MMDQLLFATYSLRDLVTYRQWAEQLGCGLELHTFVDPVVLAGDVSGMIAAHRRLLEDFPGPIGFHGAFYDMVSGSLDPGIVALTRERYRQNLYMAHVALYSTHAIEDWIDTLLPWLFCCHLNNTNGEQDLHWPLDQGIIDFGPVIEKLRQLTDPPYMTLEMPDWETIAESLSFFELPGGD